MNSKRRIPHAPTRTSVHLLHATLALLVAAWAIPRSSAAEIPPAGWSVNYSTNSFYLTRADLPGIQIAIVDDLRTDLPPDENFERLKAYFAERAGAPSLAKAETTRSFAGYYAESKGPHVRAKLIGMGHWHEGGLQVAVILNYSVEENPILGGVAQGETISDTGPVAVKIRQDLVEFLMRRYEIGQSGMEPSEVLQRLAPQHFAKKIPASRSPTHMIRLLPSSGLEAVESILSENAPTLLLFAKREADAGAMASPYASWDPALFEPFRNNFMLGPVDPYASVYWRWADEGETVLEVRKNTSKARWQRHLADPKNPKVTLTFSDRYRPLPGGSSFGLHLAFKADHAAEIAAGQRPFTDLHPREIIFLPNGSFAAGVLHSDSLPGGKTPSPVAGKYFFDGYTATFLLSSGQVIHGFAGWLPAPEDHPPRDGPDPGDADPPSPDRCSTVNVNGWIYSTYCNTRQE